MKSTRFAGAVLALCLPALMAFVPVQTRPSGPQASRPAPASSVLVRHKEAGAFRRSADLPMVGEVRTVVDRALRLSGPELGTYRRVRAALSERYGDRMAETSAAQPQYMWWWDGEKWVLVCVTGSTLEIDFAQWGKVVVQTSDQMSVDQ